MSWYRTGTVNVNSGSPNVVGVGTAWIANARAGHGFIGPDRFTYEILSVNSDTSLTLAENYAGVSLNGGSYKLMPTQGEIRELAASARTLVNDYAAVAANAGQGKFGDGTAAAPGIAFSGDPNTGMRRVSADAFALVAGGADRISINGPGAMTTIGTAVTLQSYANINCATPTLHLSTTAPDQIAAVSLRDGALTKWMIGKSGTTDFFINRFDDSGVYIDTPFQISHATGYPILDGRVGIGISPKPNATSRLFLSGDVTIAGTGTAAACMFNAYYDSSWKAFAAGFAATLRFDSTTGVMQMQISSASVASGAASAVREVARWDAAGNHIQILQGVVPALAINGQGVWTMVNNNQVRLSARGSDGVTRYKTFTLDNT